MRHQLGLEHAADEWITLFRGVAIDDLAQRQITSPTKGINHTSQSSRRLDMPKLLMVTSGIFLSKAV